jgi:serine/threonine protein kinase
MTIRSTIARDPQGAGVAGATGLVLPDTYTLGECIGQGGMGEVYLATHTRLPGRFAVKVLRSHLLTNEAAFRRFCREAEIMSALRHPHIVQIFEVSTSREAVPYFVMEFLEGVDLQTRLVQSGALPLPAAVRIVEAVASALSAAHALGIVHRDLKPANIFLMHGEGREDDFVKVIDFGISKAAGSTPSLSSASEVMGTPEFMSPEQALGRVDQVDARSDQFALAAIAYAMLTGHEPFVGRDSASLLYQVVHEQPPPVSDFVPWPATEIQSVLERALAKRPEDRFDGILKFAWALRVAAHSVTRGHERSLVTARRAQDAQRPAPSPRSPLVLPLPLPRRIDRVPRGPERIVALGLGVLALAAVVVHEGRESRIAARAVDLERHPVTSLRSEPRMLPPPKAPSRALEVEPIVTAPSEAGQPPREPASDAVSARDEAPPPAQNESRRSPRAPARPTRHHLSSRSGWQSIELRHQPLAPAAAAAFDDQAPVR